jgi:hypothetical protein
MWALRILSGSQAGVILPLKMGRNLLGRSPGCDIKIMSAGVSKEHAEIHVYKDKILVVDLRSSNGTFLNGIKVQNGLVRLGDKLSIHDVILDIVPDPEKNRPVVTFQQPVQTQTYQQPIMQQQLPVSMPEPAAVQNLQGPLQQLYSQFDDYMQRVALPGVYQLPKVIEYKMVLGLFLLIFIFAVTFLSMIPMVQITRSSITQESLRRASSLARSLAQVNQQALLQGSYSALSTHSVETEDGVKRAFIIQQSDGVILAPASQAGNSPDLPFVVTARRESKPQSSVIDSSTIGASFPIGMYDPNTGEPMVRAHAIILYDVGSLAFDDGRALSLFLQTLIIASAIGLILFYFMYKLVEYPLVNINHQLDTAMREKKDNLSLDFQFPALQALIGNINSLLTRYLHGETEGEQGSGAGQASKDSEAANLIQMMGYPAAAFRSDQTIITCNSGFEQLARNSSSMMINQGLEAIKDAALHQNVMHLLGRAREVPQSMHSDQLEFSGHLCSLSCQAMSTEQVIDFFVVAISPVESGGS